VLPPREAFATTPVLIAPTEVEPEVRAQILPPWVVILHNDDYNGMQYVVECLVKSIPGLGVQRAVKIMYEAHTHGQAHVTTCPLELAELYRDRLQSFGLTATIEKV
jgi:ATP-dependent Clp protease adaptor protein ClpS